MRKLENGGKRRTDLDVIRLFACLTILLIHFNASVCGYDIAGDFIYPNQLVPIFYFRCVYLGEIGNNLFFMLSGASLCLRRSDIPLTGKGLWRFYKKRFLTLMPAFWIAWIVATAAQLLFGKTVSGAPAWYLVFSLTGMDGYFAARGWIVNWFYQVGEWYLGCALLCYLVWPFVQWLWKKLPTTIFLAGTAAAFTLAVYLGGGNGVLVTIRVCQMVAGACFVKYIKTVRNWKLLTSSIAVAAVCVIWQDHIHAIAVSSVVCWVIFLLLALLVECLPNFFGKHAHTISVLSAYTYPIFLVHHKVISLMAARFDLSTFSYRYTVVLFIAYMIVSCVSAYVLKRVTDKVAAFFAAERCDFEMS